MVSWIGTDHHRDYNGGGSDKICNLLLIHRVVGEGVDDCGWHAEGKCRLGGRTLPRGWNVNVEVSHIWRIGRIGEDFRRRFKCVSRSVKYTYRNANLWIRAALSASQDNVNSLAPSWNSGDFFWNSCNRKERIFGQFSSLCNGDFWNENVRFGNCRVSAISYWIRRIWLGKGTMFWIILD